MHVRRAQQRLCDAPKHLGIMDHDGERASANAGASA
jgi:hypothetical protein